MTAPSAVPSAEAVEVIRIRRATQIDDDAYWGLSTERIGSGLVNRIEQAGADIDTLLTALAQLRAEIADEIEAMEDLSKDDPLMVDKMDAARGVRFNWGENDPAEATTPDQPNGPQESTNAAGTSL